MGESPTEPRSVGAEYVLAVLDHFLALVILGALAVVGGALGVLRSARLVRHRIDMCRLGDDDIRSRTVLLLRGSHRQADEAVRAVAEALATDGRVPAGVTVR